MRNYRNIYSFITIICVLLAISAWADVSAKALDTPAVQISYVPDGSAKLKPIGFNWRNYPPLETTDPNDILAGKPLYFDLHTGKTIRYKVASTKPLTKLTYTGVAFEKFTITIRDLSGNTLASAGPFDYGNHEKSVEVALPSVSQFELVINDQPSTWVLIESLAFESSGVAQNPVPSPSSSSSPRSTAAPPSPFGSAAPPTPNSTLVSDSSMTKMTEDQARAVVLIVGDNGEGTGFLIKTMEGPVVVTNMHVIGNNPNFKITTNSGALVTVLSAKAASDRDLALLSIKDAGYNYLDVSTDISKTVQPGDEVITPGNSEGGEVMLNTSGKVLGIGPVRIEFDNPIFHGNSGGPVFQPKSGKVLGVVTEAMKVDNTDELDKASFASRNSAITHTMRYFGLRIDTVSAWVPIDWNRLHTETVFLDEFDQRTRALDSYLNAPDDKKPENNLWRKDDKIMKANNNYFDQSAGSDASQRMNATRVFYSEFGDIANLDLAAIEDPRNFYGFDQQRAKDEAAYRKALKAELDSIGSDVSRMGALPRSNN